MSRLEAAQRTVRIGLEKYHAMVARREKLEEAREEWRKAVKETEEYRRKAARALEKVMELDGELNVCTEEYEKEVERAKVEVVDLEKEVEMVDEKDVVLEEKKERQGQANTDSVSSAVSL